MTTLLGGLEAETQHSGKLLQSSLAVLKANIHIYIYIYIYNEREMKPGSFIAVSACWYIKLTLYYQ
jgi:hypothetical protein